MGVELELYFEVWIFNEDTEQVESKYFSNVKEAYKYASDLKSKGFEPYITRDYRVKV